MIVAPPARTLPASQLGRVHFVGVGGAGMSGIARIMLARGLPVSGSDAKESRALAALRALGADVRVGHDAAHVDGADTVVVSTAIRDTNPEVVAARGRGLTLLPRAAALASVMAGRRAVAVAGTHGKTTTTSMLTVALQHCGADPSFAIGGHLNDSGANAHDGTGDVFVAEADESDRSFLIYTPAAVVITNVEPDHLDHYASPRAYHEAFEQFVDRLPVGGLVVACHDDQGSLRLAERARGRGYDVHTYGESAAADIRVLGLALRGPGSTFELVSHGRRHGRLSLRLPGRHNAVNAAAAFAAGLGLGYPPSELKAGLALFTGTRRRFELRGVAGEVAVYDEYAHHPTELAAALQAARQVAGRGRVVACFQPHLFSRTRVFAREFGRALGLADEVVVMDVYAAREDPEPGVTGALVASQVPLPAERVAFEPSWSQAPARVVERTRPGDVVLTIGAGDVTLVGPEVLDLLEGRTS